MSFLTFLAWEVDIPVSGSSMSGPNTPLTRRIWIDCCRAPPKKKNSAISHQNPVEVSSSWSDPLFILPRCPSAVLLPVMSSQRSGGKVLHMSKILLPLREGHNHRHRHHRRHRHRHHHHHHHHRHHHHHHYYCYYFYYCYFSYDYMICYTSIRLSVSENRVFLPHGHF